MRDEPTLTGASVWHRLIIAFVLLTCLKVWLGPIPVASPSAQAQIPNAGAQRFQQIDLLQRNTELLSDIAQTLKTGTLKVKIEQDDKQVGSAVRPPAPNKAGAKLKK